MRRLTTLQLIMIIGGVTVIGLILMIGWALTSEEEPTPTAPPASVKPAPPPKKVPRVLVSARELPPGTLITAKDLVWKKWGDNLLMSSHLLQGKIKTDLIIGAVVRVPIEQGDPITWSLIVSPEQQGFLAAVLTPNYRAATIRVNRTASHSGLLHPGDRVDVLFTMEFTSSGETSSATLTETILSGIRVVAVNRQVESISSGPNSGDDKAKARSQSGKGGVGTVTLEVLPHEAEQLVLAQTEGALSLTVRPLTEGLDKTTGTTANERITPTVLGDLLPALRQPPPVPDSRIRRVRVLRGDDRTEVVAFR